MAVPATRRRSTTCSRRRPTRCVAAYIDIAIRDLASTTQYLHFIFVFGLFVWATSMFASYAVFGHHRPLNAVVVVGVVLVGNMAITPNDQLPLPRRVQPRGAVPAHPLARLRRAVGVAAPADRRPGIDLVGLPARRDGIHRRGRGGVDRAHPDGGVGAAGGGVGRRRGRAHQRVAVALAVPPDGRLDPVVRPDLRPERPGRPAMDDQWWRSPCGSSATRPTKAALLLARGDLRPDRAQGLEPDDLHSGA